MLLLLQAAGVLRLVSVMPAAVLLLLQAAAVLCLVSVMPAAVLLLWLTAAVLRIFAQGLQDGWTDSGRKHLAQTIQFVCERGQRVSEQGWRAGEQLTHLWRWGEGGRGSRQKFFF